MRGGVGPRNAGGEKSVTQITLRIEIRNPAQRRFVD